MKKQGAAGSVRGGRGAGAGAAGRLYVLAVLALAAAAAGCRADPPASAPPQAVDATPPSAPALLLTGGPIHTGDAAQPRVEALVLRDGRVAFAGDLAAARALAADAETVDLQGAAAYPGFIDAHAHLAMIGLSAQALELTGVESLQALQARLREWAAAHPEGAIAGRGWIETHWPERRFPTRADLDAVVADRPVYLARADGHAAVANSAALALAGIDRGTADPDGGRIERGADGEPTGMLIDYAMELVEAKLPAPTREQRRAAIEAAAALYAARGWTGIGDMDARWEDVELARELAAAGRLPIRVDAFLRQADMARVLDSGPAQDDSGLVRLRGLKLYADGALGSRGAALLAPYADAPQTSGLLLMQPDALQQTLRRARGAGVQVAVHAIGDRGNRIALDAIEAAYADAPAQLRDARWRIEHAQVLAPDDVARFGRLGVIAAMQPSHAIGDLHFAPARLGAARLAGAYAWRSLLDGGAVIAGGSDAPVEKGDPLIEFYAATYRHDLGGFAGPDWHPEQAVDRAAALRLLTWGGAYAAADEGARGTLQAGKRADVSVFTVDLATAAPEAIPAAEAAMTIVDGRIVHRRGAGRDGG